MLEERVKKTMEGWVEGGHKVAVYVNHALDSSDLGHTRFLKVGEGCTFAEPPERYPDTPQHGIGWRYVLVDTLESFCDIEKWDKDPGFV